MLMESFLSNMLIDKQIKVITNDTFNGCEGKVISINLSNKYPVMVELIHKTEVKKVGFSCNELDVIEVDCVDGWLVGKTVKITCQDYQNSIGKIVSVTDEARPFLIDIDGVGIVDFCSNEFILM